jgi:parallel beta-helix repeat protein
MDNEIFANKTIGVKVSTGADPLFQKNRIHDEPEIGVLVDTNGKGTFDQNEIFANYDHGVQVTSGATPSFRKNRIYNSAGTGFSVTAEGCADGEETKGVLENNEIFANNMAGVRIVNNADPQLNGNRIYRNTKAGIFVTADGRGNLVGNEIFGNVLAGLEISFGGNPVGTRNTIRDGA